MLYRAGPRNGVRYCDLHTYVLMTNHVHLLVTPHEGGATSRMMQAIGRRYVGAFNERYRLRAHTQQQKVWGSDRFQRQIELLTQRAATLAPRGRPRQLGKCT